MECKKGTKQRQVPRRKDGRKGSRSSSQALTVAPPPTVGLQGVDFENVESVEVRGNQVILTMDEAALAGQVDGDGQMEDEMHVMDAVVKVFCVHTEPNYSLPWQRKRQYASTSSGFMVAGEDGQRYILTNAHSVEYHSQVKVKVSQWERVSASVSRLFHIFGQIFPIAVA